MAKEIKIIQIWGQGRQDTCSRNLATLEPAQPNRVRWANDLVFALFHGHWTPTVIIQIGSGTGHVRPSFFPQKTGILTQQLSTASKTRSVVSRDRYNTNKEVEYRDKQGEVWGWVEPASSQESELHGQMPTESKQVQGPRIPYTKTSKASVGLHFTLPPHSNPREKQQLLAAYGHLTPQNCTLSTWHSWTHRTTSCTVPNGTTGPEVGIWTWGWEEKQGRRGIGGLPNDGSKTVWEKASNQLWWGKLGEKFIFQEPVLFQVEHRLQLLATAILGINFCAQCHTVHQKTLWPEWRIKIKCGLWS